MNGGHDVRNGFLPIKRHSGQEPTIVRCIEYYSPKESLNVGGNRVSPLAFMEGTFKSGIVAGG